MAHKRHSNVRDSRILRVRRSPGNGRQGVLQIGSMRLRCALGRSGISALKREGDGVSPLGRWKLRGVFYRPDRIARPRTGLPVRTLRPDDGWCDTAGDRNYNRLVRLPYGQGTESMWREDPLYDLVVVIGYNDLPRSQQRGSAIFMHLAREAYAPTEGCVALNRQDLVRLLEWCGRHTRIDILP